MSLHKKITQANDLLKTGKFLEAEFLFKKILTSKPSELVSLFSMGVISMKTGDPVCSLSYFDKVLKLSPKFDKAWYSKGYVLQLLKRADEAIECYDRALQINPSYIEPLVNKGVVLQDTGRHIKAVENYNILLKLDPNNEKALANLGIILTELNKYDEAINIFERLSIVVPDYQYLQGLLCDANLRCCKWDGYNTFVEKINLGVAANQKVCKTLAFMAISDSPGDHLHCARIFADHLYPPVAERIWRGEIYAHDKIRIAYISPDFREHPVGHLMAGIFEHHDKSHYEIYAISLSVDDKSNLRNRFVAAADKFIDVRRMSSKEIAELLYSLEVDIAIDLAGYTSSSRSDIFSHRGAPLQVCYLGYAGTLGTGYMDYIIADRHVIPEDDRACFSEKVVYLPDTYFPSDSSLQIATETPNRETYGLPETGFVFCSFNHAYKLNPIIFDVWMRLLKKVPGSVLWLMKLNSLAEINLKNEAAARGVDPNRLVFATRVPRIEDHLARYRLADLFLDTTPYNAHTTACDALYVGLPVLTCRGKAFHSRVAASLLHAIGLPELVTDSLEEYEQLARRLVEDSELLSTIRVKLCSNKQTHPLFKTDLFCRNLESAYHAMWEKSQNREPPDNISLAGTVAETFLSWKQPTPVEQIEVIQSQIEDKKTIVIDAVFFQIAGSGIARVWRSLLGIWEKSHFSENIVIIDRAKTAPKYPRLRYCDAPAFNYLNAEEDRHVVQRICDNEAADLFISTYYTTPVKTKSALMVYDMIPEVYGMDLTSPQWSQKAHAIQYATHYIAISNNTASDLHRLAGISLQKIVVAPCGCYFVPPQNEQLVAFKRSHRITKPYFLLSGSRSGYKNAALFFSAFAGFGERRREYSIVCTGGQLSLEAEFSTFVGESSVHMLRLSDEELQCAYAGAIALVYPSLYEGFGMPPLEAMACGCPVITCRKASIPEVCGEAVLYVDLDNHPVEQMLVALNSIQQIDVRCELVEKGFKQSAHFSWESMAKVVSTNLIKCAGEAAYQATTKNERTVIQNSAQHVKKVQLCPCQSDKPFAECHGDLTWNRLLDFSIQSVPASKSMLEMALACAKKGNIPLADLLVRSHLAQYGDDVQALVLLGEIALKINVLQTALNYFERAYVLAKKSGYEADSTDKIRKTIDLVHKYQVTLKEEGARSKYLLIKAWGYGFWSDVDHVIGQLLICELSGRIPVIHWGDNTLFGDGTKSNAFDLYFQPVSDVSLKDIVSSEVSYFPAKWNADNLDQENINKWSGLQCRQSGITLLGRLEDIVVSDFHTPVAHLIPWIPKNTAYSAKSWYEIYRELFSRYIKLLPHIAKTIDDYYANNMCGGEWLAVHVRGSDKVTEQPDLDGLIAVYFQMIDNHVERNSSLNVFLLTDSSDYLEKFNLRYGKRLHFTDSRRTDGMKGLHHLGYPGKEVGESVLFDCFLAIKCDYFIGNGGSNVSAAIGSLKVWEEGRYVLLGRDLRSNTNIQLHNW